MPTLSFGRDRKTHWTSEPISANGLMALSLSVALGFCAICGAVLWQERRSAWDHAGQTISNLVAAINSDIARNIEQYDLSLHGVIEGLKLPEIDQVSPRTRQAILFDTSAGAKYLGAIRVLNERGDVIEVGNVIGPPRPGPTSFSNHDLFLIHKNNPDAGLYISRPFPASSGEYVIAFSRRMAAPDGAFSGVVVGTLRLDYFRDLFQKVAPSPRSALTLFATDGTVIMRFPFKQGDIGRRLVTADVLKRSKLARTGLYEKVALLDGIHRLYTYSQVSDFPLLMVVGMPLDEVYKSWRSEAWIAGLLMIALCGATIFSAVLLRRELRRRVAAEQKLAVLATTDSLTGLSNRRHFDEVIAREWQRAMREKTSIGLLIIDADRFKAYNDTYGHQTGDKLLEAIGAGIADKARRATDLGARYGGDEFTLLLPGTAGKGAFEIAERIRIGVLELRLPHSGGVETGTATVSVGVAGMVPRPGSDHCELIDAADKALYQAKANGRNRTELIEPVDAGSAGGPRLVA